MATGSNLTDRKIAEVAEVIASKHMGTIALKYFGIIQESVDDLRLLSNDLKDFNRRVLTYWRNKNYGINHVQVSNEYYILYNNNSFKNNQHTAM